MDFIFTLHSHTRWLVAAIVVIAIIRLAITVVRKSPFTGADRGLLSAAIGMIDLQMLLGVILFVWYIIDDGFSMQNDRVRLEHAVTMILAVVAAHMTARWKNADGVVRARMSLIMLLIASLLIFVGVVRLPGNGWTRSFDRAAAPLEVMR